MYTDTAVDLFQKCSCRIRCLTETTETDPAVSLKPREPNVANCYLNYLGEYEAICKTDVTGESGPYRGDCLMKKNRGLKIL
jgi:hypothetical protein